MGNRQPILLCNYYIHNIFDKQQGREWNEKKSNIEFIDSINFFVIIDETGTKQNI